MYVYMYIYISTTKLVIAGKQLRYFGDDVYKYNIYIVSGGFYGDNHRPAPIIKGYHSIHQLCCCSPNSSCQRAGRRQMVENPKQMLCQNEGYTPDPMVYPLVIQKKTLRTIAHL